MPTHTGYGPHFSLSTTWALGIKSTESSHQTAIIDVLTGTVGLEIVWIIKPLLSSHMDSSIGISFFVYGPKQHLERGERKFLCVTS